MRHRILTERVNLMEPNVYITMLVTLAGKLSEQELAKAVRLTWENWSAPTFTQNRRPAHF